MKYLILAICISFVCDSFAQYASRVLVSSSGDDFYTTSLNMQWSIGELAIEEFKNSNLILSQGFHQNYLEQVGIKDIFDKKEYNLILYPNPSNGIVNLVFDSDKTNGESLFYELIDFKGALLQKGLISFQTAALDLTEFNEGLYILNFFKTQNNKLVSKKILMLE